MYMYVAVSFHLVICIYGSSPNVLDVRYYILEHDRRNPNHWNQSIFGLPDVHASWNRPSGHLNQPENHVLYI